MPIRKSNDTLFYLIGTIPVIWLALLLAQSLGGGLPELLQNLTRALEHPTNIVWTDKSLPAILICLAAYGMAVLLYRTNQGRTRDGEEHGSAAWATPASVNAQFAQKESIPLTQHVRLGLDTHKHRRSLNVLVIGGSGAAKTRSFVLPNILTANTNYVITDPKSEVLLAAGGYLKEQGYDVRVLNLVNLEQSDGYNPFRYLRDEKDVLKLVNNLIQSTTPKGSHESDPFWTKAETALLQAIILMLFQEAPEYEQNFSMVMRVLEYAEVREEDEGHVSPLDLLFESIERRKPDSVAVRQYKVFKLDHMIAGNEAPQRPEDSETQLARIGHRLARLYQIMQENRRRVDEERQELQTLVSDISHQVKTPVSNLKMATDTLLEKPMTKAERTDFIRGIRSQTDKLDFLFQALVKTSRLETGVIQLDKKPGRLFDTVAQAMSGIVYAAEKKEIAVSVDCPEDLTVFHDSKWTSEALFNLLDNAVKYTPAGGKIAVSVVLWEMYVEIKVADTGKGISESNQAAIFRRFYREEEVHEQQGVGIGLYLAREIVTRQGGYIKVVSEPGKGSEFSIMLPTK